MRRAGAWLCAGICFLACHFDDVDLSDRPCPCLSGSFVCDTARNRCVPASTLPDGSDGDGGVATGFSAQGPSDTIRVVLGSTTTINLSVHRQPSFRDPLVVGALDPPSRVTVPAVTIAPDASEAVVAISAAADAKAGNVVDMNLAVTGGNQSVTLPLKLEIVGAPGVIDTTFGTSGVVSMQGRAAKLVEQPDGKIVFVAYDINNFTMRRFNSDGSVDATFGSGGMMAVTYGGAFANDMALQPDGGIVVVGGHDTAVTTDDFVAIRVTANGVLDSAFAAGGKYVRPTFGAASAVAVQPDGKIVILGAGSLLRLLPGGTLDTTFGGTGIVTTSIATGLALQSDGKIALSGFNGTSPQRCALLRYLPGGTLDSSFGTGGTAVSSPPDRCLQLGIASSGRFIALGDLAPPATRKFMLTRYETNGAPDATFGTGGKTTLGDGEAFTSFARQADEKIVVGGSSASRPLIRRMTSDGAPDATFGANGSLVPDMGNNVDALLILRDGRALVALSSAQLLRLWM